MCFLHLDHTAQRGWNYSEKITRLVIFIKFVYKFVWEDYKHSLEIWVVKLRLLLIYENMLKSMATTRSECTAKHKTRRATSQATFFLIWLTFVAMIEKRSKRGLKKGILIFVKSIVLIKSWFVTNNFWEFPKHHTEK